MSARYLLRTDEVRDHLDRQHWSHKRVARHLGISLGYWSQILNRRRPLSPDMRVLLLQSRLFSGMPEDAIWERVEDDQGGAS